MLLQELLTDWNRNTKNIRLQNAPSVSISSRSSIKALLYFWRLEDPYVKFMAPLWGAGNGHPYVHSCDGEALRFALTWSLSPHLVLLGPRAAICSKRSLGRWPAWPVVNLLVATPAAVTFLPHRFWQLIKAAGGSTGFQLIAAVMRFGRWALGSPEEAKMALAIVNHTKGTLRFFTSTAAGPGEISEISARASWAGDLAWFRRQRARNSGSLSFRSE